MKTAESAAKRPAAALLFGLFFATGAAGLAYQVLWAKSLAAGLGHEFSAVLAVITAFMGGIAAGAWLFNRAPWLHQDLRAYGILELVIGAWAAASAIAIPAANRAVIKILGSEPAPLAHALIVFAAVLLILLPATAAMGATFPAMQRLLAALRGGENVGALYAANTAGAMCGALASAFWLMPQFGIPSSILVLAAVNVLSGVAALWLASRAADSPASIERRLGRSVAAPNRVAASEGAWPLTVRLAWTGFLGIALETVLIRALSQVLENTVFTFAAVLATYLGATALGAVMQTKFAAMRRTPWLAAALTASSLLGGLGLWKAAAFYSSLRLAFGESIAAVAASETIVSLAVLGPPAFFMGATFATLAESSLRFRPNLGWSLAVNTAGAAVAPAVAGLLMLPTLGIHGSTAFVAAGYALLAGRSWISLAAAPALLAAMAIPAGGQMLRLQPGERVIFYKEGAMAATAVIEDARGERVLKVNHRFQMGGTAARIAEERHANIPLLLHPAPKRALFIGLGTGITFGAAAYYPGLHAEGVELLPEVVEATRLFQNDGRSLAALGLRTFVADARRFLLSSEGSYDVIVADLFHPAQDGAAFLFTRQHFAAARARLAEGGLFCQWLPVFQMDVPTLRSITRTFMEVFPQAEAWLLRFNVDTPVLGLIARQSSRPFDSDWVDARMGRPALAEHLRETGLGSTVRLLGCHVAGPGRLREFAAGGTINTDAHPAVMFQAPRLAFQKRDDPAARLLRILGEVRENRLRLPLEDASLARRVEAFIAARDEHLEGLNLEAKGQLAAAAERFVAGARKSADFTPAYAQAISLATAIAKSEPALARRILEGLADARPNVPLARELLERLDQP